MEIDAEGKGKIVNCTIKRNSKKDNFGLYDKVDLLFKINSKSNQNLVHINNDNSQHSLMPEKESKNELNNEKNISENNQIFDYSKKSSEIPSKKFRSFNTINLGKDPAEIIKTKIFRNVGKKVNNFTQSFEDKNNLLIKLFNNFVHKVSEAHQTFGFFNNNKNVDVNGKIKRMSIKFINFNEVFIFERKIIEYIEKRIFFYNKIINIIKSIFSKDNNINFDVLNSFYKEIDNGISDINIVKKNKIKDNDYSPSDLKEEQVIDSYNHKNNISILNKINDKNILSYINNLNTKLKILNTDRNEPNNNNSYKKIILPSLKTNDNQLYSNSFRNSVKCQNSKTTHKPNKRFDIFNTQNNKEISPIKKDNNGIKINLKAMNSNISKSVDIRNKDKDNDKDNNLSSKDKEITIENHSGLNNDNLRRRKSVVALTVPDYNDINNVNEYILNYKFKEEPIEEKEEIERNKEKEKEKEKKMNKEINKADKKKLKLKVQSSFKSNNTEKDKESNENIEKKEIKKDFKEKESKLNKKNNIKIINKKDDNSIDKDNSDDGGNSSANSFGRGSNKSNESEENKEKENGNIKIVSSKTVSSCESKDPLDDIKYLKRMREKQENIRLKDIEYLFSDSEEKSEEKSEENNNS